MGQQGKIKPGGLEGREEFTITDIDGITYIATAQKIANLAPGVSDILTIPTTETNTDLVLKPDGAGGLVFGVDVGIVLTNGEGTTANGSAVDLGGTATSDVTLALGTNDFIFNTSGGQANGTTISNSGIVIDNSANDILIGLNSGSLNLIDTNDGSEFYISRPSTGVVRITCDATNFAGLQYNADYSTDFVALSIVNKAYSDSYFTGALTDGTPTNAEIIAILGTAASRGAGYKAVIKDSDGTGLTYHITCDGTNYYYTISIQAA